MSKVAAFSRFQINNVVASLRQLANRIEAGELPAEHVVVVRVAPAEVNYHAFGPEPFTRWQAAGALAAAQHLVLSDGD